MENKQHTQGLRYLLQGWSQAVKNCLSVSRLLGIACDMEKPEINPDLNFTTAAQGLELQLWHSSACGNCFHTWAVRLCPQNAPAFTPFTGADLPVNPMASASGIWGVEYELTNTLYILDFSVDASVQAMMMLNKRKSHFLKQFAFASILAASCRNKCNSFLLSSSLVLHQQIHSTKRKQIRS